MNQREINRASEDERWEMVTKAAKEIDAALNLFGIEDDPIRPMLDCPIDQLDSLANKLLEPDCSCRRRGCDHAFPPWFVREAAPVVRRFVRLRRQVEIAGGR